MAPFLLGQEIRRLRLESGLSLRGLGARIQASAAHLSDIEHDRRRPSEQLLRKIAFALREGGATFESLERLWTGLDAETQEWASSTPGVRALLRLVRESGREPREILRVLERSEARRRDGRKPRALGNGRTKVGR
jgi:transcriptional regulator with XRE-family HTH domain